MKDTWNSAATAAYPAMMNLELARAINLLVESPVDPVSSVITRRLRLAERLSPTMGNVSLTELPQQTRPTEEPAPYDPPFSPTPTAVKEPSPVEATSVPVPPSPSREVAPPSPGEPRASRPAYAPEPTKVIGGRDSRVYPSACQLEDTFADVGPNAACEGT